MISQPVTQSTLIRAATGSTESNYRATTWGGLSMCSRECFQRSSASERRTRSPYSRASPGAAVRASGGSVTVPLPLLLLGYTDSWGGRNRIADRTLCPGAALVTPPNLLRTRRAEPSGTGWRVGVVVRRGGLNAHVVACVVLPREFACR